MHWLKGLALIMVFSLAGLVLFAIAPNGTARAQENPMSLASTEHWQFFPRRFDDKTAYIFYDEGISGRINEADLPDLLIVRLMFKAPRPDGLSSREEFDQLSAFEDRLTALVGQLGGLYVGRITFDGYRRFHIFVPAGIGHEEPFARLARETGYKLDFSMSADPDKSGYWRDLYPDADEKQIIGDQNVLFSLQENGDNPQTARQIDHLVYLPSEDAREAFRSWIEGEGYKLIRINQMEEGELRFSIEFTHVGRTVLGEISSHSIAISRRARELGGAYDGWGTTVEAQ
jgi:hypothetical protein